MKPINWDVIFNYKIWQITKWITGVVLIWTITVYLVLECSRKGDIQKKVNLVVEDIIVACRSSQSQLRAFWNDFANQKGKNEIFD